MSLQYIVKQSSVFCLCQQDSGVHLSVIDDSNEHMLTVWDWQKKSKIAEIKVCGHLFSLFSSISHSFKSFSYFSRFVHVLSYCIIDAVIFYLLRLVLYLLFFCQWAVVVDD